MTITEIITILHPEAMAASWPQSFEGWPLHKLVRRSYERGFLVLGIVEIVVMCAQFIIKYVLVARNTLLGTNISSQKGTFEDDFPFPRVGYVSSLEGIMYCIKLFLSMVQQVLEKSTVLLYALCLSLSLSLYIYVYTLMIPILGLIPTSSMFLWSQTWS